MVFLHTFVHMESNHSKKAILIIMDGWGMAEDQSVSAIAAAETPFFDRAQHAYPFTKLEASGLAVGLPEGQMGNSEVGHMNIGAGRIVFQDLVRINRELETGDFGQNETYRKLVDYCRSNQKPLHLLGLLSDGGVHSSIEHLKGIIRQLAQDEVPQVFIHAFTDGRDTSPHGGKSYMQDLLDTLHEVKLGQVASIVGRYYAMDRDKRWPRVRKAYDALVNGVGTPAQDPVGAIEAAYEAGTTDEFIEPIVMTDNEGKPLGSIQAEDAVLFFNFRTDRGRQLTQVLTQQDMPEEGMHPLPLHYATMTRYDETFQDIKVLYEKPNLTNGLGEQLARLGKKQIRIAETEKYAHVTYFFNGGREEPMAGEQHVLCPSPKVPTYDLQPEMSAHDIRDRIIQAIEQDDDLDFVCLNFANPDMVGHTGVFEAAVKACATVDACTQAVVEAAAKRGFKVLVTADHGNSDKMRNPDGSAHTAHTTALVPLFLIDPDQKWTLKDQMGKLGDLAPTLLALMELEKPEDMTGEVLVEQI